MNAAHVPTRDALCPVGSAARSLAGCAAAASRGGGAPARRPLRFASAALAAAAASMLAASRRRRGTARHRRCPRSRGARGGPRRSRSCGAASPHVEHLPPLRVGRELRVGERRLHKPEKHARSDLRTSGAKRGRAPSRAPTPPAPSPPLVRRVALDGRAPPPPPAAAAGRPTPRTAGSCASARGRRPRARVRLGISTSSPTARSAPQRCSRRRRQPPRQPLVKVVARRRASRPPPPQPPPKRRSPRRETRSAAPSAAARSSSATSSSSGEDADTCISRNLMPGSWPWIPWRRDRLEDAEELRSAAAWRGRGARGSAPAAPRASTPPARAPPWLAAPRRTRACGTSFASFELRLAAVVGEAARPSSPSAARAPRARVADA